MEGCLVRMVDRIAYAGRDYEDALSVLGTLPSLPSKVTRVLGADNRVIINNLVTDMIRENMRTPYRVGFSDEAFDALRALYEYSCKHIYYHPQLVEYASRAENMLGVIFDFEQRELTNRPQRQWGCVRESDPMPVRELHHFIQKLYLKGHRPSLNQIVVDHISLMTDRYARNFFQEIFLPKPVG
jgi:dGTPase